jgi:hypothetical protein
MWHKCERLLGNVVPSKSTLWLCGKGVAFYGNVDFIGNILLWHVVTHTNTGCLAGTDQMTNTRFLKQIP